MFKRPLNRPERPAVALRGAAAVRALKSEAARRAAEHDRWLAERLYRTQVPASIL